ncbi:bifunctional nuclease family protein [Larkinella sp. GY13]|uniref:bifunctional nuclease family protein n=1 Tax=Larkinella sp. GY13 TaxID=3453720 RepID=UPI003EEFAA53
MKKIRLNILNLTVSHTHPGLFELILKEVNHDRQLVLKIGIHEAQAILIEQEKIVPSRPMTHDLFKSFLENTDYTILEIVITRKQEETYFAEIACADGSHEFRIDARPSDAIAIGLRVNTPFYANESLFL